MRLLFCLVTSLTPLLALSQLSRFVLTGNPESQNGAIWTYQDTINGGDFNLQGILFKPAGTGIFPAVIIIHGTGGNATTFKPVATEMVKWGFVCIATNYTHSGNVPCGSPGDCVQSEFGASNNNILRGMKCWDILSSLGYVDTNCIASFGHSRGAFLTTALVGMHPEKFSVAGHTAGGVSPSTGFTAPTVSIAQQISAPYIIHHGDADVVVPIAMDSLLNTTLNSTGTLHEFHVYPGYDHNDIKLDSLMFARTRSFFELYGCNNQTGVAFTVENLFDVFPNPSSGLFHIGLNNDNQKVSIEIVDVTGKIFFSTKTSDNNLIIDLTEQQPGIYFLRVTNANATRTKKLLLIPGQ